MKALINSYNDVGTIKETLDSLKGFEVHIFDGKYRDFPGAINDSTDGTKEICNSFPNVIYHEAQPNETQCEKRTRMLSVIKIGEYFLRIDADEVLLNPETLLTEFIKDVYWAWEISNLYADPFMKPRIYKKIEGMHVAGRHHFFFDKNNDLITSDQLIGKRYSYADLPLRIYNMRHLRSPKRELLKIHYAKTRVERKFTEMNTYNKPQKTITHPFKAPATRQQMRILKNEGADYTLSLLFTRPWAVDRFFNNLEKTWLPPKTEIICIVDSNDARLFLQVANRIRKMRGRFSTIKLLFTKQAKAQEKTVIERRFRISRNMNIMLTEAQGKIILGAEDDSLPDNPDTYKILIENLKDNNADLVQGTIVGRWKPIIPAWHVTEQNGQLVQIETGDKKTGLEEIQGCGWYGYAAKAETMRKTRIHTDYCKFIGPDFHFGYDIWKAGGKVLHNHDLPFTHFGEGFEIKITAPVKKARWIKRGKDWKPA